VHILVLNNYVDYDIGDPQWNFAKNDLETSTAKFKIVAFHKPAVCYGGHDIDSDMLSMTTLIFEKNGVDFVMNGHNHYYQHNLKNGIHHMVIGSMGAPLYSPSTGTYTIHSEKVESFAIFDTDGGNNLTMRTYRGLDSTPIETIVICAFGETVGRTIGDTNYDCKVNLADFAALALNWMADKSLKSSF
jgi:hypothetical protein